MGVFFRWHVEFRDSVVGTSVPRVLASGTSVPKPTRSVSFFLLDSSSYLTSRSHPLRYRGLARRSSLPLRSQQATRPFPHTFPLIHIHSPITIRTMSAPFLPRKSLHHDIPPWVQQGARHYVSLNVSNRTEKPLLVPSIANALIQGLAH